ncbi:hypothetical protein EDB83DRAFT_2369413 [Lactarius deliciosus]|nr:hypothetical protein EDB83DRAFT_2369413 [Lactarius deliciosus]
MKERAHFFPAHGPDDSPKYYTLDALRQLNGHAFIDRKIDVDGVPSLTRWPHSWRRTSRSAHLRVRRS